MTTTRPRWVFAAVGIACLLSACAPTVVSGQSRAVAGADESTADPTASDDPTASVDPGAGADVPSSSTVDDALSDVFGSQIVSGSEAWVEGADRDSAMTGKLKRAGASSTVSFDISDVTDTGTVAGEPTASAIGEWTVNGQTNPVTVPLVYVSGHWKIAKEFSCNMLQASGMTSSVCP